MPRHVVISVWYAAVVGGLTTAAAVFWRPDPSTDWVWLKWLIIPLFGYIAFFHLAKVIGFGVGRLLEPGHGRLDRNALFGGGEQVLQVSRWRETLIALGSLAITIGYAWVFRHLHPVMGAIGVPTFGSFALANGLLALVPSRLTLNASGFEVRHWSGAPVTVAWGDIEPLYVFSDARYGYVCYRYLEGRLPKRLGWAQRYYRAVGVGDGTIPSALPVDKQTLCDLMNEMRQAWSRPGASRSVSHRP